MAADFLDSNVLLYAFSNDRRAPVAQALLERGCTISVQGLNEFANVARRKLRKSWPEIRDDLAAIRTVCGAIVPVTLAMHDAALRLAEHYRFQVFDALMVAAALDSGSGTLWSEDMQHGLVVDRTLRIANPFLSGS